MIDEITEMLYVVARKNVIMEDAGMSGNSGAASSAGGTCASGATPKGSLSIRRNRIVFYHSNRHTAIPEAKGIAAKEADGDSTDGKDGPQPASAPKPTGRLSPRRRFGRKTD
jgi:hypothetical protein